MYEHDGPSEEFLVVDLSLEEEEAAPDTSQDEDITHKLCGDLNCGLLRPSSNGSIIIISDTEEEAVYEDDHADADADAAPSSLRVSHAPSIAADNDTPDGVQDDSSDGGDGADTP
jgi:hypothetical protein